MTQLSFGDLAQSVALRRQNAEMKARFQAASTEVVTGKAADAGAALRGDFIGLAAIDASLGRLAGYKAATTEAALMAGTMQTALGTISTLAADLGADLLTVTAAGQAGQVDALGSEARQSFLTAVATLNTRVGDRALFGGVETTGSPLPDGEVLLAAIMQSVGGATSAQDMADAVDDWFNDPAGYAAHYSGGAPRDGLPIAPGTAVTLDLTAEDASLRQTLAGLATAALLDFGVLSGNPVARADLAQAAAVRLADNAPVRTQTAARLGVTEARIEAATTRNAAEVTALSLARNGLLSVDPYEAVTRLEEAETQLQSLYTITARLSRLSLVDYL